MPLSQAPSFGHVILESHDMFISIVDGLRSSFQSLMLSHKLFLALSAVKVENCGSPIDDAPFEGLQDDSMSYFMTTAVGVRVSDCCEKASLHVDTEFVVWSTKSLALISWFSENRLIPLFRSHEPPKRKASHGAD